VNARALAGGPAPTTTRQALADARNRLQTDRDALLADREKLQKADEQRRERIDRLM
jgi:hypothetical protein